MAAPHGAVSPQRPAKAAVSGAAQPLPAPPHSPAYQLPAPVQRAVGKPFSAPLPPAGAEVPVRRTAVAPGQPDRTDGSARPPAARPTPPAAPAAPVRLRAAAPAPPAPLPVQRSAVTPATAAASPAPTPGPARARAPHPTPPTPPVPSIQRRAARAPTPPPTSPPTSPPRSTDTRSRGSGGGSGGGKSTGGTAGFDARALTDGQFDELVHRLIGPLTRLLRAEFRHDRERIGKLRDPRR
jgi:hypothetical protein